MWIYGYGWICDVSVVVWKGVIVGWVLCLDSCILCIRVYEVIEYDIFYSRVDIFLLDNFWIVVFWVEFWYVMCDWYRGCDGRD